MNNNNILIEDARKSDFVLPVIGTFAFSFFLYIKAVSIGGTAAFTLVQKVPSLTDYYTYMELFSNILVFVFFFLWVKLAEKREISSMGLRKENGLKDTVKGFALGIVSFLLVVVIMMMLNLIDFNGFNLNAKSLIGVIIIIPFWFIQAGSEELFSRGFVLPIVSAKSNRILGVALSSIVFTLIHVENRGITPLAIVNIIIVGIFLGIYALYSENIWGAIGFHAAWNYVQGCILGLSVSGNIPMDPRIMTWSTKGEGLMSGGKFGAEGSLIATFVLGALTIFIFVMYMKKQKQEQQNLNAN